MKKYNEWYLKKHDEIRKKLDKIRNSAPLEVGVSIPKYTAKQLEDLVGLEAYDHLLLKVYKEDKMLRCPKCRDLTANYPVVPSDGKCLRCHILLVEYSLTEAEKQSRTY